MFEKYMKNNQKILALFFICVSIFCTIFYLYHIPLDAVLYGFLLCSVVLFLCFFIGYFRYLKRYNALLQLEETILIGIEHLPPSDNMVEYRYAEIVRTLHQEYQNLTAKHSVAKLEMLDFYTLWVHQIKTPISAIDLLLQVDDLPQKREISQELFKIEQYTQLVLGYLRIDDISGDLLLKKYSIDKIINRAVKKYAIMFIHKKISIELMNIDKTVITDEKWLLFVIEQLLSNGLKYTQAGKIKIYMQGSELVIEDTGIGITQEDLPRIFEKNFTGFNGRIDEASTGLGLYLCKKIVDKLGHHIAVTSTQGVGTRVVIDLTQSNHV